jgi:dihydrolipoamide dehydrogenase
MTNSSVEKIDTSGEGVKAFVKQLKSNPRSGYVAFCCWNKTNIENIGLEEVGIATDKDKILVNEYYNTNIPGYYAIGDVTPGQSLAHVAAEGINCVENWNTCRPYRLRKCTRLYVCFS